MGNCINSSLENTLYHPQLGHLQKEYHQNYTVEYFKATLKLNSIQEYQQWSSEVRKLKYNPETKDFLYLPQKMVFKQKDIFKKQPLVYVFYEPYIQTLEDLMQRYIKKEQFPSQEMIWYLIYTLIKVGKYYQKINKKIGNIIPSSIVITPSKQFKVICEKSTLQFISPIEEVRLKLSYKALLAPEQIQFLNESQSTKSQQTVNPQLSQVYSMGILVLAVATSIQPHTLYHYNQDLSDSYSIDYQKIDKLLTIMRRSKRFSELLIQTVLQMIEVKLSNRIKSSRLFERLVEYEYEILSKKGLNYSGDEIEKIKQSLNSSNLSRNPNNSILTHGNKTLQNHTLSFRVSEIGQNEEQMQSISDHHHFKNNEFINIL